MEELKVIVRKIRSGESVKGYALDGDILKGPDGWFKVQGSDRLRLVEVPVEAKTCADTTNVQETQGKPRPVQTKVQKTYLLERECMCGRIFPLTKFNQNISECAECRKAKKRSRSTGSVNRDFICPECGEKFTVSKFQPYYNPERCQKCNKKRATKKSHQK